MNAKLLKLLCNDQEMSEVYKRIFLAASHNHNSIIVPLSNEQITILENHLYTIIPRVTKRPYQNKKFYKIIW